jgi:hypothetical protein
MLRKLLAQPTVLAAAKCTFGCYKKFQSGRWVCVTCGN